MHTLSPSSCFLLSISQKRSSNVKFPWNLAMNSSLMRPHLDGTRPKRVKRVLNTLFAVPSRHLPSSVMLCSEGTPNIAQTRSCSSMNSAGSPSSTPEYSLSGKSGSVPVTTAGPGSIAPRRRDSQRLASRGPPKCTRDGGERRLKRGWKIRRRACRRERHTQKLNTKKNILKFKFENLKITPQNMYTISLN